MKRLCLVALFLMGFVATMWGQGGDGLKIGDTTWKFDGEIRFMYTDQTDPDNWDFFVKDSDSFNRMYQRYRLGISAQMGDSLKAYYMLQVGDEQWGNKNYNEREINLRSLYAYLEFTPEWLGTTAIRVGLQPYDDLFQYSVFSDEAIGLLVMPTTDKLAARIGFLTLRDDDVDQDVGYYKSKLGFISEGILPCADTLFLADATYKMTDSLTIKGAFFYEYLRNLPVVSEDISMTHNMAFYGVGADYASETLGYGAHFIMRSGTTDIYNDSDELAGTYDFSGYFAYAYGSYTMNDFTVKVNFGYTPWKNETENDAEGVTHYTKSNWAGAFAMVEMDDGEALYFGHNSGNQWMSAYGLEYYGRGDVCDRQALMNSYGGYEGLMVISINASYKWAFANLGFIRSSSDIYYTDDPEADIFDTNIGTEIDLGVKTEIMKNLQFSIVYAMFMPGDYWMYDMSSDTELGTAHELSTQLKYTF